VDPFNFRFTVWFYDDATNDQRNDWIGLGTSGPTYTDYVLGVYSDKTRYSYYPAWTASAVNRAVGWHKLHFIGNAASVKFYVDDRFVYALPSKGPVKGVTIVAT